MWVVMNDSFVSVVEHWDDSALLVVRGRFAGDVARFLDVDPGREEVTPQRDYRFRIVARRRDVEKALQRALARVTYPNFKDSFRDGFRMVPAIRTWQAWYDAQHDRLSARAADKYDVPDWFHDGLERDHDEPYEPGQA